VEDNVNLSRLQYEFPGNAASLEDSPFVFFGVPFDSGTSAASGAREGPRAVRAIVQGMELWSEFFSKDLERAGIYDAGDVAVSHGDAAVTGGMVSSVASWIRGLGKTPIMFGGEHTFTPYAAEATEADALIVVDAHADCRKEFLGNELSHATSTRRWVEKGRKALLVGVRAFSSEEIAYCAEKNVSMVRARAVASANFAGILRDFLSDGDVAYLSIDLDGFDPSFAPGVGTPEPIGISPSDVLKLMDALRNYRVAGMDVMELCPARDPSWITAALAAKLVLEFCASRLS